MTGRHDLAVTLPWLREGTALLTAVAGRLTGEQFAEPSLLPGWTRAHVVGHVARNAEALGRLAAWARTGVPTPMYAGGEQRAAEIEASATRPPDVLRDELATTAAALDAALSGLDERAWHAQVHSALGRAIPATEIPWLRVREVWLHAVDLAAGVDVDALPAGLVGALLDEVTGVLNTRPGCPPLRLAPVDGDRILRLGPATTTIVDVTAPAPMLLAWLTGRAEAATVGAPAELTLPRWL